MDMAGIPGKHIYELEELSYKELEVFNDKRTNLWID